MQNDIASAGNTNNRADILRDLESLISAFERGVDLKEVRSISEDITEKVRESSGDIFFPWYCLIVAHVWDLLRKMTDGKDLFFPDFATSDLRGILEIAKDVQEGMQHLSAPLTRGAEVTDFLHGITAAFVDFCWSVVNPIESRIGEVGKENVPWKLLHAIPEGDIDRNDCWSIYGDFNALRGAGRLEPVNVIGAIFKLEHGV